jgi:spermidine synthase
MTAAFVRLVQWVFLACSLVPGLVTLCSHTLPAGQEYRVSWIELLVHLLAVFVLNAVLRLSLRRVAAGLDARSREQASFLDALSPDLVDRAIAFSAFLSLALELAIIRWQGSVFELFALYKNLGLLACFAGLGLGYALARRDHIPLIATIPLLSLQLLLLTFLRYGMPGPNTVTNGLSWRIQSLLATPFPEQRNMGFAVAGTLPQFVAGYAFLATVFLLTALTLLPVGQLCGRLMTRRPELRAYALNLLGSLLGVVAMLAAGWLWSPPLVWFSPLFVGILLFLWYDRRALLAGSVSALVAAVTLAWPVSFLRDRIYSPYQMIERGPTPRGLVSLRAAGHYYQRVYDLSVDAQKTSEDVRRVAFYYEMPYRVHGRPSRVAVLGAGTGNDVAAALRAGAERVDAVEIDPVIQMIGTFYHPEHPYDDPRVQAVIDDARSFLRAEGEPYDLIVYGLLDSHTLVSHASSVRLESFVYTVEGLRAARRRLRDDGLVSLSFAIVSREIGRKIYLMMTEAFDGHPPLCLRGDYDGSVLFLQRKDGGITLPPNLTLDRRAGFWVMQRFDDQAVHADVSTDDWPFLYTAVRTYPRSHLLMGLAVVLLTVILTRSFTGESPSFSGGVFFFLGAGFMLLETKAITELGLAFGNTWQVVGISISGILVMAFFATWFVERTQFRGVVLPFALLLAGLGLGFVMSRAGGLPSTPLGRLGTVGVLTCPVLFSGILFARFLEAEKSVSSAMAANLLGAMCGGLLEYNSMYFGFRFLYGLAAVLYLIAFVLAWSGRSGRLRREMEEGTKVA